MHLASLGAAVGVIYKPADHSQLFHFGHKNDIISLTVSSCGRFCATGDLGKDVSVRIWDALTGQLLNNLDKVHWRGVSHLAFSPDSKYLVSIGMDDNHTTCVYETLNGEWNDGHRISKETGVSERAKRAGRSMKTRIRATTKLTLFSILFCSLASPLIH